MKRTILTVLAVTAAFTVGVLTAPEPAPAIIETTILTPVSRTPHGPEGPWTHSEATLPDRQETPSRNVERKPPEHSVSPGGTGETTVSGEAAPDDTEVPASQISSVMACIRTAESGGNYQAISPDGLYRGAWQLSVTYSDDWARRYGFGLWATLPADRWPREVQDAVAVQLFAAWPGAWSTYGGCA